ncbi:MAG: DUF2764 domain-containing protein [Fusobacteriaceae bacterium]|nr:DUF2764 domain-containing protein [Fusobacteriaceae bacterium]
MSSRDFRELCESHLKKKEIKLFDFCILGVNEKMDLVKLEKGLTWSSFINSWIKRECSLVYSLAKFRAIKQKKEISIENFYVSQEVEALSRSAFMLENPLEAELMLDKGRWEAVDALLASDYFSIDVVYAYYIKLLLLERRYSFATEEGFSEYQALYEEILKGTSGTGVAGDTK